MAEIPAQVIVQDRDGFMAEKGTVTPSVGAGMRVSALDAELVRLFASCKFSSGLVHRAVWP